MTAVEAAAAATTTGRLELDYGMLFMSRSALLVGETLRHGHRPRPRSSGTHTSYVGSLTRLAPFPTESTIDLILVESSQIADMAPCQQATTSALTLLVLEAHGVRYGATPNMA